MRAAATATAALVLVLGVLPASRANPVPVPRENPELRVALKLAIVHGERGNCGNLTELLGGRDHYVLEQPTLSLIGENMKVLEPCIIASQCAPYRLDSDLQAVFRRSASREGAGMMRSVLRERVVIPRELLALQDPAVSASGEEGGRTQWAIQEFLRAMEGLADYRAPQDTELLAAVYDTLSHLPADSLMLQRSTRPSWFVHMALRRIDDPPGGAVFLPVDGRQALRFVRADCPIEGVTIYSYQDLGQGHHPLSIEPEMVAAIFRRLASSPAASPGENIVKRAARLEVRYRDGVTATATGFSQGWVLYTDNTRYAGSAFSVRNPELAGDILALTALARPEGATDAD